MSNVVSSEDWIPLVDYSVKTGISLSTLRRHIKAGKILYKIEGGRYLLFFNDTPTDQASVYCDRLKIELNKANEEIAELKTLIALYEEQMPQ
ncbi:MAG: hypothetical protein AABZ06_07415 [Bdellovibrionota bacterium]